MAGFAIRSRFAGHAGRSAKTRHALRLNSDHSIGARQNPKPRSVRLTKCALRPALRQPMIALDVTETLLRAGAVCMIRCPPSNGFEGTSMRMGPHRSSTRSYSTIGCRTERRKALLAPWQTVTCLSSFTPQTRNSSSLLPQNSESRSSRNPQLSRSWSRPSERSLDRYKKVRVRDHGLGAVTSRNKLNRGAISKGIQ